MAGTHFDGFAELAVADNANVLPLPDSFSFEQGAAFPVVYCTAFAAIDQLARVQEGRGFSSMRRPAELASRRSSCCAIAEQRSSARPRPRSTTSSGSRASSTRSTTTRRTSRPR